MATPQRRPRRADAERSIARIVAAARKVLGANPRASTDEVAREAGVGRMTLYGHFRTRADLVEAALIDALADGERVLRDVDLTGDPRAVLRALLGSSWELLAEAAGLQEAADGVVSAERLRDLHGNPAQRIDDLVRRGQREGAFRTDLPTPWLVGSMHYLLHGAATEVRAGRLDEGEASRVVTSTIESIILPPEGSAHGSRPHPSG